MKDVYRTEQIIWIIYSINIHVYATGIDVTELNARQCRVTNKQTKSNKDYWWTEVEQNKRKNTHKNETIKKKKEIMAIILTTYCM